MHPIVLLTAALLTGQTPPTPSAAPAPTSPAAAKSATALDQLIDGIEARTSKIVDYEAKFHQEVTRKHGSITSPMERCCGPMRLERSSRTNSR